MMSPIRYKRNEHHTNSTYFTVEFQNITVSWVEFTYFCCPDLIKFNMDLPKFRYVLPVRAQPVSLCIPLGVNAAKISVSMICGQSSCGLVAYYRSSRMSDRLVLTPQLCLPPALRCFFICVLVCMTALQVSFDILPLSFLSPH